MREKHRLMVFENMVLRRIFRPKRNEATGQWRRLHNEEPYDLYSSPNIIRVIKSRKQVGRACSTYWERRGAHRVVVGKPGGRRLLRKPRRGNKYNIQSDLREVEKGY